MSAIPPPMVFDLDGALLDISERFYRVYSDILAERQLPRLPKEVYWGLRRRHVSTRDIVLRTCGESVVPWFYEERMRRIEDREYLKYDRLTGGALEVLQAIHQERPMALVTLRDHPENLAAQLEWLGIADLFQRIRSGNSFGDWTVKSRLIRDLDLAAPEKSLMVGDTEIDVLAGRDCGLRTCAVTYGIRTAELLRAAQPDFLVDRPEEILRAAAATVSG
ncbi:MAG: HAD family hydrolase [Candidatus Sumerlaeota bacterium]|nr:HAD family hydrolase [Candidatus Sumerlaeota bacterium]